MSTQTRSEHEPRTYGNWTRPRNEGLWGLGWATTMAGFAAIVIAMIAAMVASYVVGAAVAVLEILVLAPMAVRFQGRTGYERGILMMQWLRTRARGEHVYVSGTFSKLGTHQLPGLLAPSRLYEGVDSWRNRFGMVHMPDWDLYTVVLRCWPQGARAVDQAMIDHWVASWGTFIATLGAKHDVEAIVPVIDTVPETGNRLATEVRQLTRDDAPQMSKDMMAELAENPAPTGRP